MMDVVSQLCKAEELVLDTRASTLPTAKAYLQLHKLRWFVACRKYSAYFQDFLSSLVKLEARKVLSSDIDMTWN